MSNREIERYRSFSNWFLKMFAIEAVVLGQENWESLPEVANNDGTMPILAGLTHKDYIDGPVLWQALSDEEIMLQIVVMREGFSGGFKELRNLFSNRVAPSLQLSRNGAGREELKTIQERGEKDSAVALYLSGNRKLTSPLKGGITTLMRDQDVMYPFVNLADHAPVFLSESTIKQNARQLLDRAVLKRVDSQEFLYLMKPLSRQNIDELAEGKRGKVGREEILQKLEVIRSYGVLKTFIEVAKLDQASTNPLLHNADNLPLFIKSQTKLLSDSVRVEWLYTQGYFEADDLKIMLSLVFGHN